MEVNPQLTELTTGITDAILAMLAAGSFVWILLYRCQNTVKAGIWLVIFAMLFVASALGAVSHSFLMTQNAQAWLWQPLYLALGVMMAMIAVGAAHDNWGSATGRRFMIPALGLALVFYAVTLVADGMFIVFVIYEATVMLFALAIFARLGKPGARRLACGIAVSIAAAIVQAIHSLEFKLVWEFDHNGIFHIIQMPGVFFLAAGVVAGLKSTTQPMANNTQGRDPFLEICSSNES